MGNSKKTNTPAKSHILPVKKNDEITLTIDSIGSEGQGIGRYEGMAVFVPNALPGETVRVHIIKVDKRYAVARLMGIVSPSPDRITPECDSFYMCGGCSLQHLRYESQLDYKRMQVIDALRRLGGIDVDESLIAPTVGMESPYAYRNKASFPVGTINGAVSVGMFAKRSHRLIAVTNCMIQTEQSMRAMDAVTSWANEHAVEVYDEFTHTGLLRHLVVRTTKDAKVLVIIVARDDLPETQSLVDILKRDVPGLTGVVFNKNAQRTNVILGDEFKTLWGESHVYENILNVSFRVSPQSFLQVNHTQTEVMYSRVLDYLELTGDEHVLDIYCGIGTISLLIAGKAAEVTGIESVAQSIEDARYNAKINNIDNASFIVGEAENILPKLVYDGMRPDAIVIDPPRKGCDEAVLKAIGDSGVNKLIYISCNPATLARDVKLLSEHDFTLRAATPVDMFPWSSHVETVVLLSHKKPDSQISVKVEFGEGEDKVPLDKIAERAESYKPKERVTYKLIKEYIEAKYGFKVHTAYIAEVKRSFGLPMYDAPNAVEELKQPRKHPTPEKVEAIKDALRYFGVI